MLGSAMFTHESSSTCSSWAARLPAAGPSHRQLAPAPLCRGFRVSRAYRKSHTPPQQSSVFRGGMNHSASLSAPARRTRRIVLVSLAILGIAIAAFVVRPSLVASAPSSSSADVGQSTSRQTALDEADGVIPDGVAVSVFDEEIPAVGKLDPDLLDALRRAATDAEADGVGLTVTSGWRSPEYQQRLLQDAVVEYGSQEEAARWVATAETSAHVSGEAVDIGPFDAAAWLSEHGAAYGLCQIYGNESWHYELSPDAVDDGCPPMYADPTEDPRMQP
jgi:zinc D-Ala-D-Ala carboxypeptidase